MPSALADSDNLQPRLGQRLKAIRKARGLSLETVSRETQISRSFLSLVENGHNEITIGRLVRLVGYFGIHVGDFFNGKDDDSGHVVRRADQRRIPSSDEGMEFRVLAPDDERSMLPLMIEVEPGGGLAEWGRHPGEEFVHVLEGELTLQLEGAAPIALRPGDTGWFEGERGHLLSNRTDRVTKFLSVISPPNL